jgi:hypothetical protein
MNRLLVCLAGNSDYPGKIAPASGQKHLPYAEEDLVKEAGVQGSAEHFAPNAEPLFAFQYR